MEGASSMILYQYENSVCAQKVRITLAEKKLEWEAREVDLFKSEQYDPEYLKLNPKGVVPTLIHEGRPINESTLICEYLDEVFPDPPLIPEDPYQRTQVRLWRQMEKKQTFQIFVSNVTPALRRNNAKHPKTYLYI